MLTFILEGTLVLKHTTLYTLNRPHLNEACLQPLEQETPSVYHTSTPLNPRNDQNVISYFASYENSSSSKVRASTGFLCTWLTYSGLKKSIIQLSGTRRLLSFPLVQWARDQTRKSSGI